MSPELVSMSGDPVAEAPAVDCCPDLSAPAPYGSSCGWWAHVRTAPRRSFGLSPAEPRGGRLGHQALAGEHPPQAWLQGEAPVTPIRAT